MMKKSVFVKTFACLFTTTIVAGALSYSQERFEPKRVDLSAFKNAANNIQHLAKKTEIKEDVITTDVTAGIVKSIEKEVKGKILRTRYAIAPKKTERKVLAIAKNWNDIKPEFKAVDYKTKNQGIQTLTINDANTEFEINNKELIKLYAYKVEALSFESFTNTTVESYEVPEVLKTDEVRVAQASTSTHVVEEIIPEASVNSAETTQEIAQAEIATKENSINDDLVVFDYSEADASSEGAKVIEAQAQPTVAAKKLFDAPLSKSVQNVINREVHKTASPIMNTQFVTPTKKLVAKTETTNNQSELEKAMNDEDNDVYDYSQQTQAALAKNAEKSVSSFTSNNGPEAATQIEFTIKAKEINLNTQKTKAVFGYEFVPDYDRAERMDDQTSGEIKLAYSLSSDVNTQTGVVQAFGLIPTRVELNLLNKGMNIPLINEDGIQAFLKKKQLEVVGNLLMVAVDPSITDVEIDSDYQAKIFFNSNFKLVEAQANASYVLFLGVKTGNVLLRYLLANKESAQKIAYVGDGEMYFEDPDFVNTQRELYTFTTRSLLGRKVKELNINGSDITVFGTNITSKKKALNAYEIKIPELVENSRKYLEFKHMGTSLFVGTEGKKDIEIPGKDFIARVLQANELSEIGERCMVQINLSKDIQNIKVSGKNRSGEMFAETSFLDNDGNFSRDNSELAEKVFVTGDLEGLLSVRLDYTDRSTDFLKTFCSEGAYLIEQL